MIAGISILAALVVVLGLSFYFTHGIRSEEVDQ